MTPAAQYFSRYADLKGAADIIDETDANDIYLGFARPGHTNEATAGWSICRITKAANIIRIRWANGAFQFNLTWNDRATYTYTYKGF